MTVSDFFAFFLGVISWKGALLFNGGLNLYVARGAHHPMGTLALMGVGG